MSEGYRRALRALREQEEAAALAAKKAKRAASRRDRRLRARAREYLLFFMEELRRIFKLRAGAEYERFPDQKRPCSTCAFQRSTDSWRGFETTAWGLLQAIRDGKPFYCHANMDRDANGWVFDPARAELCGGWAVVQSDPAVKDAYIRAAAMLAAREPIDT